MMPTTYPQRNETVVLQRDARKVSKRHVAINALERLVRKWRKQAAKLRTERGVVGEIAAITKENAADELEKSLKMKDEG